MTEKNSQEHAGESPDVDSLKRHLRQMSPSQLAAWGECVLEPCFSLAAAAPVSSDVGPKNVISEQRSCLLANVQKALARIRSGCREGVCKEDQTLPENAEWLNAVLDFPGDSAACAIYVFLTHLDMALMVQHLGGNASVEGRDGFVRIIAPIARATGASEASVAGKLLRAAIAITGQPVPPPRPLPPSDQP